MDGNEIYLKISNDRINNAIKENKKWKSIAGFSSFISNMQPTSAYNYILRVSEFLRETGKNESELTLDDFTGYLASKRGTTASYQITTYAALKKYSKYLKASNRIKDDYMAYVSRPKARDSQKTIEKRSHGYLDTEEIRKYIAKIETGCGSHKARARQKEWKERDKLIILMFLSTGMRCSALFKLNVSNIDLEHGRITVTDKGDKVFNYVISADLYKSIIEWLEKRKSILAGIQEDALFINCQKKRISQKGITDIVNKYAAAIGRPEISPHKLRATYGTQLYNQTKDLVFVQTCMNHNNPRTTELYIRGDKEQYKTAAADIMSKMLF